MKKERSAKNNLISRLSPGLIPVLVFMFFVLVHLPDLGHDNFNTDVWRWKARSYGFSTGFFGGKFDQTLQKYHPGVTLMWIGTTGIKIVNFISDMKIQSSEIQDDVSAIFQLDFVQKLLVVMVIGFSVASVFKVLIEIFGLKYALLSVLMLTFEPFYLGLTRVFHLEGLVSTFMLASIIWLYYYFLDTGKYKRLIISGVFAGLAVLTKTSALFLVLYTGLNTLILIYRKGRLDFKNNRTLQLFLKQVLLFFGRFSKIFFKWFGVLIAAFFILWPAMWLIPGRVFQTLYGGVTDVGVEGDHFQFYFGKLVEDPGPGFYFVVLALRSSIYLLIGFIGTLIVRKKLPENMRKFLDYLLIFIFFYFIQLTLPTKKLDRYILPVLLVFSLVSSMFYLWVFERINFKNLWQKYLCIILFFIPAIYTSVLVHPDYLSYFNPVFGGLKTGVKVIEPKWIIGKDEIIDYFTQLSVDTGMEPSWDTSFEKIVYESDGKNLKKAMTVGFQEKYYSQVWPFFRQKGYWAVIESLAPFAHITKYFVYPVWDDASSQETRLELTYFDTIKLRGVPVYNVYKNLNEGVHD